MITPCSAWPSASLTETSMLAYWGWLMLGLEVRFKLNLAFIAFACHEFN